MNTKAAEWREARKRPMSVENRFMVELGPFHDLVFLAGPLDGEQKIITCHKLMLARSSEVFSSMFYGANVTVFTDDEPVLVPDIDPLAFDTMIDYVYSGELYAENFHVGCGVLYAAKKYQLADLANQCRAFLWSRLYPSNVWSGLEYTSCHSEKQLHSTALQIIQRKTSKLLEHRSFKKALPETIMTLLEQDYLTLTSELELYNACVRWAGMEATRRGIGQEPPQLRTVLGPAFKLIRFLTMTTEELESGPFKDGLLTKDEVATLRENDVTRNLCDNSSPRFPPNDDTFFTFGFNNECGQTHIDNEYFENTYDVFSLAFSSSGDFTSTQLGVQVPTQVKPEGENISTDYDEDLTLILYDLSAGEMLSKTKFKGKVNYDDVIDIPFKQMVKLTRKRVRKVVKIIFHKAGKYPSKYKPENGKENELKVCKFANVDDVKLWHKSSYSYIHFCAYTVDV